MGKEGLLQWGLFLLVNVSPKSDIYRQFLPLKYSIYFSMIVNLFARIDVQYKTLFQFNMLIKHLELLLIQCGAVVWCDVYY